MKYSGAIAVSALVATVSAQANYTVSCVKGLHVIVNRASQEALGYGILGPVKDQILAAIPDSDSVFNPYEATLANYTTSEPDGVTNLTKLITEYVDACPCSKIALLGYSQGAHVIGDTTIGRDYPAFPGFGPVTTGVGSKYLDQTVALIMMGDPANVAGVPILVGNSTHNGTFPRANSASWTTDGLVGKTQSYCDADDTFCDSGKDGAASLAVHIGYIPIYGKAAADYVVKKYNESPTGTQCSGGSGNSTSSATGTGSTGSSGSSSNSTGSGTSSPSSYGTPSPSTSAPVTAQTTNSGVKVGISSALLFAAVAAVL